MDDDRTTAEAIQDLLTSQVGQAMIHPGHEQAFAGNWKPLSMASTSTAGRGTRLYGRGVARLLRATDGA